MEPTVSCRDERGPETTLNIPLPRTILDCSRTTHVMGVINTTPDSFSDGGVHLEADIAISSAIEMLDAGASIVDVGGESTRPGSSEIPVEEELERAIPVIEGLISQRAEAVISIDTRRLEVAEAAVQAGAQIINDISGFRDDPRMIPLARESGAAVCVMHMLGRPKTMQTEIVYKAFPDDVVTFLRERIQELEDAGIDPAKIIVDPGIGFGKTFDHNLILINRLDVFRSLGKPVLIGPSRKAFLGKILGLPEASQRDLGTVAVVAASVVRGANIVRVHDVPSTVQACKVVDAVLREKVEP